MAEKPKGAVADPGEPGVPNPAGAPAATPSTEMVPTAGEQWGGAAVAPDAAGRRRYRMKPYRVTAVRWDGTVESAQAAAVAAPLLKVIVIRDSHPLSVKPPIILLNLPDEHGKNMQMRDPGWIVQGEAGGLFFCTDQEFADIYEPDPEGAEA